MLKIPNVRQKSLFKLLKYLQGEWISTEFKKKIQSLLNSSNCHTGTEALGQILVVPGDDLICCFSWCGPIEGLWYIIHFPTYLP